MDETGKFPGGSQIFPDQTNGLTVVVQMEYSNLFSVRFMSEDKKLAKGPESFTREYLEKKIAQTQGRLIEFIIQDVKGCVKAICLKKFLAGCPRSV